MPILWCDFETRSRCDLKTAGVYNYAQDISTDVLCMSYAFDDEEVVTWTPDQQFPEAVRQFKGQIRAHNAAFERLIFWYVLQINFKLEQFYCTAAQARANCAPGSLEDVGRFAGTTMKKDHRGAQLIRLLSVPKDNGTFRHDYTLMAEMIAYCEQDVRVMRAVSSAMRQLSDEELLDYHVNERINDRGILVDVPLAKAAINYSAIEIKSLQKAMRALTCGEIMNVRSPALHKWVWDRVGDDIKRLMTVEKLGAPTTSLDSAVRKAILNSLAPEEVVEAVQIADDIWASSTAKFQRMTELADVEDHRVRGAFVFAGGSATGRATSYGLQVHNLPRVCAKDPEQLRRAMLAEKKLTPFYGKRVTDALKGMLRPALVPAPGHVLIVADWSAIEARMNPWLSARGQDKLDLFRAGADVYKHNAAATFHVPVEEVSKDQRQLGKVQELACGYGGGVGAFNAMGRVYGVLLPEAESRRMVDAWRRANPWAVRYWQDLEGAYTRAMRNPGHEFSAGRVTYLFDGQTLWYELPSRRILCYPYARLEADGVSYAKASWKPAADAKEWPRARLWRGLAAENICQAAANDILRAALRRVEGVVLHVHDEIVLEVPEAQAEEAAQELKRVMCEPPAWADGLPLDAEVGVMTRYGKG